MRGQSYIWLGVCLSLLAQFTLASEGGQSQSSTCAFAISDLVKQGSYGRGTDDVAREAHWHFVRIENIFDQDFKTSKEIAHAANGRPERPSTDVKDRHGFLVHYETGEHAGDRGVIPYGDYLSLWNKARKMNDAVKLGEKGTVHFSTNDHGEISRYLETMDTLEQINQSRNNRRKMMLGCLISSSGAGFLGSTIFGLNYGHAGLRAKSKIFTEAQKTVVGTMEGHLARYREALEKLREAGKIGSTPEQIDQIIASEKKWLEDRARAGDTPRYGARVGDYDLGTLYDTGRPTKVGPSMEEITNWSRGRATRDAKQLDSNTLEKEVGEPQSVTKYLPYDGVFTRDELKTFAEARPHTLKGAGMIVGEIAVGTVGSFLAGAALCRSRGGEWLTKKIFSEPATPKVAPAMPGPLARLREITREVASGKKGAFANQHYAVFAVLKTGEHLGVLLEVNHGRRPEMRLTAVETKLSVEYLFDKPVPPPPPPAPPKPVAVVPPPPPPPPPPKVDYRPMLAKLGKSMVLRHLPSMLKAEDLAGVNKIFDEAATLSPEMTTSEFGDFKKVFDGLVGEDEPASKVQKMRDALDEIKAKRRPN